MRRITSFYVSRHFRWNLSASEVVGLFVWSTVGFLPNYISVKQMYRCMHVSSHAITNLESHVKKYDNLISYDCVDQFIRINIIIMNDLFPTIHTFIHRIRVFDEIEDWKRIKSSLSTKFLISVYVPITYSQIQSIWIWALKWRLIRVLLLASDSKMQQFMGNAALTILALLQEFWR